MRFSCPADLTWLHPLAPLPHLPQALHNQGVARNASHSSPAIVEAPILTPLAIVTQDS